MHNLLMTVRRSPVLIYGALTPLIAIVAVELASRSVVRMPSLILLLIIVALVGFVSGRRGGLLSATITSLYGAYYYFDSGPYFGYNGLAVLRVFQLTVASFAIALMTGVLRNAVRVSEQRLRDQLAFSRAIQNSLGEGLYAVDLTGRLSFMNPAAERLLGWMDSELLGRDMHDAIHYRRPDGSPFPRAECHGLANVLQAGSITRIEDDVFVRKDGTLFPVAYTAAPIVVEGDSMGVVVAFRDMSERKRTQHALEARARQQAVVAHLGRQALASVDIDNFMEGIAVTAAATLNVEYAQLFALLPDRRSLRLCAGAGWPDDQIGAQTVSASPASQAGYTLQQNAPVVVDDFRTERRFGMPPYPHESGIVSSMSVVVRGREHPFGILEVASTRHQPFTQDDTFFLQSVANILTAALDRQAYERQLAIERDESERLQELDHLRKEFIATVSHDLRTPLTALRAALGMLESGLDDRLRAEERGLIGNARRNVERLRMLIDDLLALNQLEAGTLRLECEPIDLRGVVSDSLSAVEQVFAKKEQVLTVDLPEPLIADVDARRMEQVVINLLANAGTHTPKGTLISVTGSVVDGEVRLAVRDNGPGIPTGAAETVFEQFKRLGPDETGSGLGLAIVRGIVELHRGRVWVESDVGQGATFNVALPRATNGETACQ